MTQTTDLRIHGMTCGGCAARVEAALRSVAGVSQAAVNLMTESARVTADPATAPRERLIEAVRATGYDAEVAPSHAEIAERLADDAEHRVTLRRHRQAVVQAVGLALPIVALDHFRHALWGPDAASQTACRLMQTVLLVMLGVSPGGGPVLAGGLRAVLHRTANMDLLITMGVVTAFVSSVFGAFVARDEAYVHFHAAAMILALVAVGRYLEARAKGRASAAMTALARRAPKSALVRRDGQLVTTPVAELAVGDIISVPAHATIATDGDVIEGDATVDERMMTGEPMPVRRTVGDAVHGGTVVVDGGLVIRATAVGREAAIGRIVQMVARAQSGGTRMQRMADRVAGVFTPFVIAVAAATFIGWLAAGGWAALPDATRAAVAVLVVACPCALGLATPTVVMVGSGTAATRGILVRDAAALEAMGRVDTVVWDKTGTLTQGAPIVRDIAPADGWDRSALLELAASAESMSDHPLARAIVAAARREGTAVREPTEFRAVVGGGVTASVNGRRVAVGSRAFLDNYARSVAARSDVTATPVAPRGLKPAARDGLPASRAACPLRAASRVLGPGVEVAVAIDGADAGTIRLDDAVRPSARDAVARLARLGVTSEMLTGDQAPAARVVGETVGIEQIHAGVDPAGKVARIEDLRRSGLRVAMVGDGVNDAAALAAADVGVAFATGADVAGEAAGINLVGSTPHLVADAVELARAAVRVMRQNLFGAFIYNVVMIPWAATGTLPPAAAAGAMMASSLTVVLNALRLPRVVSSIHHAVEADGRLSVGFVTRR